MAWLAPLASLRLTVALFLLAIFLVFAGTLAQKDHDVWHVVNHTYFRVWVARVDLLAFQRLVEMVYKPAWESSTLSFPFPGGMLIGSLLAANLLAAHAVRFKVSAKGRTRFLGLLTTAVGAALGGALLLADQAGGVEGALSPGVQDLLWHLLRASLGGAALAGAWWLASGAGGVGRLEWQLGAGLTASVGALAAWLLMHPEARLDPAGLRILWVLALCTGVALVLMGGCAMLFARRGGVVLLHAGILLMMSGELATYLWADEAQMSIAEGESQSYAYDVRTTELAFVDRSDPASDSVVVVPQSLLAARVGETLSDPRLPVDLRVERFVRNSILVPAGAGAENPATVGPGTALVAHAVGGVTGVGGGAVNTPSVYVELLDKRSGESLGVRLFSTAFIAATMASDAPRGIVQQEFAAGGKQYDAELRFKRDYKPYSVELKQFRFDRYAGTNTPKNYSSDVVIRDPAHGVERAARISMNNPARHAGDTLYQQSFDRATERVTVLQVVSNTGRMIPYLSCAMVAVGMGFHFWFTLQRFLRRRAGEAERVVSATPRGPRDGAPWRRPAVWAPVLMALVWGGYLTSKARPPRDPQGAIAVQRFGGLAVVHGGRVKPIDTLARTTLQHLSGRQELEVKRLAPGAGFLDQLRHRMRRDRTIPAVTWLLDTVTGKPEARAEYRVLRIDHLDLLDALGLPKRPGSFRYTYDEVTSEGAGLQKQVELARSVPAEERTTFHRRVLELNGRVLTLQILTTAFGAPQFSPNAVAEAQRRGEVEAAIATVRALRAAERDDLHTPRVVPPLEASGEWRTLFEAELTDLLDQAKGQAGNPATAAWSAALLAYDRGDAPAFARALTGLEAQLEAFQGKLRAPMNADAVAGLAPAEMLTLSRVRFERFFSAFSPFYYAAVTYLVAFLVAALSWLAWPRVLGRSATAIVAVTFLVHTFALVGRVYISGRPPVTNLYSSAVFIGWACVLLGLVLETVYRMGIGTVVASVIGFLTLVIAQLLSLDGDTFTVLQAVLDTQFWLATHVVCITLGYATTLLAGFLGAVHLLASLFRALNAQRAQLVHRMTYGVLCFALFFSFVGTVLGGLWADDSWGRFWGWDPKENGALIIVLWNALVLHARWGAMIGPAGLAGLAVLGNVVTAWSWFGVNELGVGLHSYGFQEGTSLWLLVFATTQLAIASLAVAPAGGRAPPLSA